MSIIRYRKNVVSPPFNGAEWWESETVPEDKVEARINELAEHGPHNPFDTGITGQKWFCYSIQVV